MKKKSVITIIILAVILIVAGIIVWKATEFPRYRKHTEQSIERQIAEIRGGDYPTFFFLISEKLMDDKPFQEFLVEQVNQMYENGEYVMLEAFLSEIENVEDLHQSHHCSALNRAVSDGFDAITDPEEQISCYRRLQYLDYYCNALTLSADAREIYNQSYSSSHSSSGSSGRSNSSSSSSGTCARCHQRDATNGVYCESCYYAVVVELADNGISVNEVDEWANDNPYYED